MYEIAEVGGLDNRATIEWFNSLDSIFPPLTMQHLVKGYWWLAYLDDDPVAFAGMVPMDPFPNVGYFKRCYVKPDHHGRGLQYRLMCVRETKARQLGWKQIVSECHEGNMHSASNFKRAGFEQCWPEQPWAVDSIYWMKKL